MSAMGQNVAEKERTYVNSVISSGIHGGTLFTGLFGSIILHHFGWASVFNFVGLLSYLWLGILYSYGDTRNFTAIPVKENPNTENIPAKAAKSLPWGRVLRAPPFWAMLAGHFANGYVYFVYLFWLPTFFHERFPQAQPWVCNVLPWLISMITAALFGIFATYLLKLGFSKTFTRKSLHLIATLLFGTCLIGIGYTHTYESTLLIICVASACNGAYQSTIVMNPCDITPDHTGLVFGVMNTFGAIPGFIGTYISGAILEATGNWNLMYAVTGWVSITGWAIFGYWGSGDPIV